eukprot:4470368-Pyramimonas_sp.AAC.1
MANPHGDGVVLHCPEVVHVRQGDWTAARRHSRLGNRAGPCVIRWARENQRTWGFTSYGKAAEDAA